MDTNSLTDNLFFGFILHLVLFSENKSRFDFELTHHQHYLIFRFE